MKISLKAIAIATAVLWGGAILFLGRANLASPPYGLSFLQMVSSVYPGFHASRTIGDVLVGTGYALIDGAIGGFFFGSIYNVSLCGTVPEFPADNHANGARAKAQSGGLECRKTA